MTKLEFLLTAFKKVLMVLIIGVGCFFFGLFLAIVSPIIAILSLIPRSEKDKIAWAEKLKKFDEKLKEIQDPDRKEDWKKKHMDLYGSDDE